MSFAPGPSQRKRFKPDNDSENSKLLYKTPEEINKALTTQGNTDAIIKAIGSIQWQFRNPGPHHTTLKQWLQTTSAEALLNLWDDLAGEAANVKVLSMVISLLSTIIRYQSSSSDSNNRLARSLLSTARMSKLNVCLAGKRDGSNSNVGLVAETLNLLSALVAWDSKTILETVRWDIDAIHRILRRSWGRKDGKGKGKLKAQHGADARARAALLSLIIAMLSQDVPARIKSAFLGPGTQTLILLQNVLCGLGDSHEEECLYPYTQIKNLLETLYAGVWCDKRVSRTVKVTIFAFGHGHMRNDGGKKGQVSGEKVWKGLLALYARTELESSGEEGSEDGIPADLVHHFLLALCTRPGQGVCFHDKGWYPSNYSDKASYGEEVDFNHNLTHPSNDDEDTQTNSSRFPIHNPLLLRVLRLLAPLADPRQQELAARILAACPELVASCGDVISGGPGALDPRLNARWMVGMAWYGRVVGLPVPEEMLYLPSSGGATARTPRVTPPPLRSVVESIVPSFTGGGTKTILTKSLSSGSGTEIQGATPSQDVYSLSLVQHTTAITLCRCLGKLLRVRTALLGAARAAGEPEGDVRFGARSIGPWTRRLTEVTKEIRTRMPDVQVVLAFLKHIEAAESSSSTSKANPTALALLSESAYRLVWLYHACFVSITTTSVAEERLGSFDVGSLVASLSMFSGELSEKGEEGGEMDGLRTMKDVHILRILRLSGDLFGSRMFGKAGTHKQTIFLLLLRAFAKGSTVGGSLKAGHAVLQNEINQLLKEVLARSVLFRRSEELEDRDRHGGGAEEEVDVWLTSLAACKGPLDVDVIVAFVDDCAQRCMRTPERYLDALDGIREDSILNESFQSNFPSPLLMTLLEQLDHRIHAVVIEEQQRPMDQTSSSLLSLFTFVRGLFVRLAALCEPRALPVLWALAGKITSGKSFEGGQEDSPTIRSIRTEATRLYKMLKFSGSEGHDSEIDSISSGFEDFEVLYVEKSTITRLADPSWRSILVKKMFAGHDVHGDSNAFRDAFVLRAVRLISHSLSAVTHSSSVDRHEVIDSLLSLLAQIMAELGENSTTISNTLKQYLFSGNEALRRLWIGAEEPSACETIDTLLRSSALHAGNVTDRVIVADVTEHWVSFLENQLQDVGSEESMDSDRKFALALVWLRYAHPHVLCRLFDLAYTSRLQPGLKATTVAVISTTIEALESHTLTAAGARSDIGSNSTLEAQLRSQLPMFLSLSSDQRRESPLKSLNPLALEQLIQYTLQSRLPIGHDGLPLEPWFNVSPSHSRRRHQWQQRLEFLSDIANSDIFKQHYLTQNGEAWSKVTTGIVCNAIYSGCIELAALNAWLFGANSDRDFPPLNYIAPILHASLDCVRAQCVSGTSENQQEVFWRAYEVHFPSLVNAAFSAVPSSASEIQAVCGACVTTVLDLVDMSPNLNNGRNLTGLLVKHVKTLPVDKMSLELLMVGKKGVSGSDNGLVEIGEAVVDHALQWAVRMFTGCREIKDEDARLLSELIDAVAATSGVKSHLAEPVLTAVVREHPYSEIALRLLEVLVPKAQLKPLIVNRHLQILLQHPHFAKFTTASTKCALVNVLYTLFHLHPVNTCQPSHVQPLITLYGGSASVADRKLLAIFYLFEEQRRTSIASLLTRWSLSPEGFQSTSALEALKDVDSLLVLRTALHFPQWRILGNVDNDWEERPEGSDIYDPIFMILLLAHVLAEDAPNTAPGWVELFRTNIVGLTIRALSAKDESLRELAAAQIAILWRRLEHADMLEKPNVFHILSLLRDALHPVHGQAPDRLSSYTTLLLAHALRGVFYPSNFVYPITARFLLQRPTLDTGDVPMLYGMLYSSAEDHGKKDRAWIIRMLADGMQSSLDWRIFKRRHTWDLLSSAFQSEDKEPALRRGVLEVLANLTCIPQATMSLLLKSSILPWIEMQLLKPQEDEGMAWLKVIENITVVADDQKMEASTDGEWRTCIARCLSLLIDGCKIVRTFPVFHLLVGVILRLALLPGPPLAQMTKLLTRCVSVVQDQQLFTTIPSIRSEPLFKAPHGAFRLHDVPQLSDSALCEAQGDVIEQLWRVSMLVSVEEKLPAWDELSSLLLVWRACVGERSVVGEWVRREVVRNMTIKK